MDWDRHTSRVKWSEAGVPKKDWTCVAVEDLELDYWRPREGARSVSEIPCAAT